MAQPWLPGREANCPPTG